MAKSSGDHAWDPSDGLEEDESDQLNVGER